MTTIIGIKTLILVFSLLLGSLSNMLIYRLPRQQDIVFSRSGCYHCGKVLSWLSLFPIISYIVQRGQSTCCDKHIPIRYLIVECLFFALACMYTLIPSAFYGNLHLTLFSAICIILFFTDLEEYCLPLSLNIGLIMLGLVYIWLGQIPIDILIPSVIGIVTLLLFRFVCNAIYKKDTLGLGDIFLLAALMINWGVTTGIISLYIAVILGGLFSLSLVLLGKRKRSDYIPFGPFIFIGFFVAYFFSEQILHIIL